MKITNCKTFFVEGIKYNWTLFKIETDAGVHGWGEGTNWPGSPLVEAACQHVGDFITGQDARRIDYLWTKVYRDMNWLGQAGPLLSAISAMDIALWDLKGKAAGMPVYQLLGGQYRSKIQLYANYWFISGGHSPEDYARQAKETAALGFTALKFDPFAHVNYWYGEDLSDNNGLTEKQKRLALDVVDAVAKAVGPEVAIAIETHAFLNGPTAVEMAHRLAKLGFNCMWYEEPALPEFPDAIADIRRRIPLPVCVGERLHSRFMLRGILEKQAADIVMPDITRCGGISEMRKMANLAALIIGVEMAQEPQELLRPVLGVTLAGHLALGHFQRREQRGGAVAHVVVRPRAGPPALERQPGWRETVCGMPHFARHTLRGDFPFAWIDFANDHWPGRAGL